MPSMDRIRIWSILAFLLLVSGCATVEDVRILDEEVYRLQSQLKGVQKDQNANKNDLMAFRREFQNGIGVLQAETLKRQTEAQTIQQQNQADLLLQKEILNETLRADLLAQKESLKHSLRADFLLQKETLQADLRTISTALEEYKEFLKRPSKEIIRVRDDLLVRITNLEDKSKPYEERNKILEDRSKVLEDRMKRVEDRFKGVEARLGGLEAKIGGLEARIGETVSKPVEPERSVPGKEKEPIPETRGISAIVGDLYRDAYETFQKGNLEEARQKFEAFLKQYPNTELSDNAQFWVGETYYRKKDFEKAILEYEKAITRYPEGDKIPAALFKQALAFSELGDKTNARSLLRKLIERYPRSDQADLARKQLETLK